MPAKPTAPRPLTEEEARKRVEDEKGFYGNLASYLLVIPLLAAINLVSGAEYLWFLWPALGWGIGLASHGLGVFGVPGIGRGWEERRVQALTGAEASESRLRALVDEELGARALPAGQTQDLAQLQRRIEHLEAIVTATDDPADPFARDRRPLADLFDGSDAAPSPVATPRFDALDEDPADDEPAPRQRARTG